MYEIIYKAWKREKENTDLQKLPEDFYKELIAYMSRIRREGRMLDNKSVKADLVTQELINAEWLTEQLVLLRARKLADNITTGESHGAESLTREEQKVLAGLKPINGNLQSFLREIIRGRRPKSKGKVESHDRVLVRFLQEVPPIVGSDLKTYGPFLAEDIATLPIENTRVLIRRGVAVQID